MRFRFIAAEKASHSVTMLVSVSACDARVDSMRGGGGPNRRTRGDDRRLKVLVRASFEESKQRYGSPRIHRDLLEQQERVSRKRVIRLMQEEGLKARVRKRFKCTTMSDHDQPVAANLLDRQFTAEAPNQRWVGDTTEFVIGESGKLYLAAMLDLFSRFIVGWAVSAVNDRHLTIKALEMARATPRSRRRVAASLRPGVHVRQRGLPGDPRRARHHVQYESARQLSRQRGDGSLLLVAEDASSPIGSRATAKPRWRCSTTSRCSITSAAGTPRSDT